MEAEKCFEWWQSRDRAVRSLNPNTHLPYVMEYVGYDWFGRMYEIIYYLPLSFKLVM